MPSTADGERLKALRDGPGGWDYSGWLAIVDYLSWWRIRNHYVVDSRLQGDHYEPRTYAEVYYAKYGFTIESQHAKRVGIYGDPVGIGARRAGRDGTGRRQRAAAGTADARAATASARAASARSRAAARSSSCTDSGDGRVVDSAH